MPLPTRYFVYIRFREPLTPSRIKVSTEMALKTLRKLAMSETDFTLAFSSRDAGTFGCLIKTTDFAGGIRNKLNECGELAAEKILVLELGKDSASLGLGNPQRWLDHH